MPREIITIQIGQCGNQSILFFIQLEASFGNNFVSSMESVPLEFSNSMQLIVKSKTEKMFSSIKLMTITMFLDLSSLIFSQEYKVFYQRLSIVFKMVLSHNYIIPKIYLFQRKEVVQVITGQVDILKLKRFNNK